MKSKWNLIVSIFWIVIGTMATATFIVLAIYGENLIKWIITLILAIGFIGLGVIGIINYISDK